MAVPVNWRVRRRGHAEYFNISGVVRDRRFGPALTVKSKHMLGGTVANIAIQWQLGSFAAAYRQRSIRRHQGWMRPVGQDSGR